MWFELKWSSCRGLPGAFLALALKLRILVIPLFLPRADGLQSELPGEASFLSLLESGLLCAARSQLQGTFKGEQSWVIVQPSLARFLPL